MLYFLRFTWFCLFGTLVGYSIYIYPQLPETVSTHFNFKGQTDAVGTKLVFFTVIGVIGFLLNDLFFILSIFLKKIPLSILSIPWKKYWLSSNELKEIVFYRLKSVLALAGTFVNGVLFLIVFVSAHVSIDKPCYVGDFLQQNGVLIIISSTIILLSATFLLLKGGEK